MGALLGSTVVLKDMGPGYRKVFLNSDQGRSLKAVAQAVKNVWSGEITLASSPVGDSKGNGEAERAGQSQTGDGDACDSEAAITLSRVAH